MTDQEKAPGRIQRKRRTVRLTLPQLRIINYLRGTGRYVGADALSKERNCFRFALRSLNALRRIGLIEHVIVGDYHLTDAGREWHRVGRPLRFCITRWTDEHFNRRVNIQER